VQRARLQSAITGGGGGGGCAVAAAAARALQRGRGSCLTVSRTQRRMLRLPKP